MTEVRASLLVLIAPAHLCIGIKTAMTPKHIALLGNFPPRRCGIATFTADTQSALLRAFPDVSVDIFAMDAGQNLEYPSHIRNISQDDPSSYLSAAHAINSGGAEILWVQHEFGIFGGSAGEYLLTLLNNITIPVVVTMHTVLEKPDPDQRRVTEAIIAKASKIIVMAEQGRYILQEMYGVRADCIAVIPHGVPDKPFVSTAAAKDKLGLTGRQVILTFGLLSPDKGIRSMIEAMPTIQASCPNVTYLILGATHPDLLQHEGESLRDSLKARAAEVGISDNVKWIDRFAEFDDLMLYLSAADIYVTPYLNPQQITSGTLSYAAGLGKAIVSTPFVHARELLSDGCGVLVEFDDPAGLSQSISALLGDSEYREKLGRRAYDKARTMIWPRYAERAMGLFADILDEPELNVALLSRSDVRPFANFDAVARMSDGTGMLQHGRFSIPDRDHGYCVDDNARALMLVARCPDLDARSRMTWTATYASFVQHSWNCETSRFRNFMSFSRQWLEEIGSQDSSGRAVWALGVTARDHPDPLTRQWAIHFYNEVLGEFGDMDSPRACAFLMLGASAFLDTECDHQPSLELLRRYGNKLQRLHGDVSRPDWCWFENVLAYDNCRMPEALLRAGQKLRDHNFIEMGIASLRWISDCQISETGQFRAVGSGSFGQVYRQPLPFDQQPVEAWAAIDAYSAALDVTGDKSWIACAATAFNWFLGENDARRPIAELATGICYDGLVPTGVNFNQGAESVLSWQLAVITYRAMAQLVTADQEEQVAA